MIKKKSFVPSLIILFYILLFEPWSFYNKKINNYKIVLDKQDYEALNDKIKAYENIKNSHTRIDLYKSLRFINDNFDEEIVNTNRLSLDDMLFNKFISKSKYKSPKSYEEDIIKYKIESLYRNKYRNMKLEKDNMNVYHTRWLVKESIRDMREYVSYIRKLCKTKYTSVPYEIVVGLAFVENKFRKVGTSKANAVGFLQITEGCLSDYNRVHKEKISFDQIKRNWKLNVKVGIWYLNLQIKYSDGLVMEGIRKYNYGPNSKSKGYGSYSYSLKVLSAMYMFRYHNIDNRKGTLYNFKDKKVFRQIKEYRLSKNLSNCDKLESLETIKYRYIVL